MNSELSADEIPDDDLDVFIKKLQIKEVRAIFSSNLFLFNFEI